jgi:uroporphyrinogen decarboxylase
MRQAGRYMRTYRDLREKVGFMELCRTPELVCQVTLMPIEQLGVDAAILFSDILVPLEGMGLEVDLEEGPRVRPALRDRAAIDGLVVEEAAARVDYVADAVRLVRRELGDELPLIGFAGAPFTLASYAIEGGPSKHHHELKHLMYGDPDAFHALLGKLTRVVTDCLRRQIEAGCDTIQLFDSWAGVLDVDQYETFAARYVRQVLDNLADLGVPRIVFVPDAAHLWPRLAKLPCEVLGADWRLPLGEVRRLVGDKVALQGNLDPGVLRAPWQEIQRGVVRTLASYGPGPGHVFNLGHGITPDASVDAARVLVDAVKLYGPQYGHSAG